MSTTTDPEFKLPGIVVPQASAFEPQHTPDDLDNEAYALCRLPTDEELEQAAEDIKQILSCNGIAEQNKNMAIGNNILRLLAKTRKGY